MFKCFSIYIILSKLEYHVLICMEKKYAKYCYEFTSFLAYLHKSVQHIVYCWKYDESKGCAKLVQFYMQTLNIIIRTCANIMV